MSMAKHVHFRGLEQSDSLTERIDGHLERLERQCGNMRRCNVSVELLNHRCGKLGSYKVVIEVDVPGERLVVGHEPEASARGDAFAAISAAFEAMGRRLKKYMELLRRETKHHVESKGKGRIQRLFPYEGFGFISTEDGREIYFNENSVLGADFEDLEAGTPVRYAEEAGDKGPQASTVQVIKSGRSKPAAGFASGL